MKGKISELYNFENDVKDEEGKDGVTNEVDFLTPAKENEYRMISLEQFY